MNEDKNIQAVDSELSVDNVQEHLELLNEEAESAAATPADKDYSTLTLNEILDTFAQVMARKDQNEMYRMAEILKSSFYKVLRRERAAAERPETEETEKPEMPYAVEESRFKDMYSEYKIQRANYLQEQEKQKEINLESKLAVIEELKKLLDTQEDINRTFPEFKALQARWKEIGQIPQPRMKEVWESYQFLVEKFYDFVKINNELRDLDLKKNLEIKEDLCAQAEALLNENSIVDAFKSLQKLHEEWRETGPVPKDLRESTWNRFKEATSQINRKYQTFFDELKEERKANLEKKTALCEQAEAIVAKIDNVQASDWANLTKEMEKLQNDWKTIGFAAKKDNQKIYDRFKESCDRFYTAKREYFAEFKNVLQSNLDAKIALCEQAEAVMDSEEWKKTSDTLIQLQKEWKKVGPVARKHSDAVWKRFRAACDHFFDNKAAHNKSVDSEYVHNLELKKALVEEIKAYQKVGDSEKDVEAMKAFQERWREIGFVPFKEKDNIQKQYKEAMDLHFAEIRSVESENRMNRFARRIHDIKENTKDGGNRVMKQERDRLMQRYYKLENDIKTLENNVGFFSKSKNAEALIQEMNHKVEQAREDLSQIEMKIKMIDKQISEK